MARRVLMADESGRRVRGIPRLGWVVGVKMALCSRGMTGVCATWCERWEGVASPGAYVQDCVCA